jgi:hypothetical protein
MTLVGGSWPCRLFEVSGEPIVGPADHKFGFLELRVDREVESWRALGPNGQEVAALIAWLEGDGGKAWGKRINDAARSAAWSAAWSAARSAAESAALALCVRDLITPEEFSLLYNSTTIADALPADSLGPWDSLKGRVLG